MRIIAIAALAAFAVAPVAASAETPQQKETSVWQVYKDKKVEKFMGLVAPTYVGVYAEGTINRDREIQMMKETNLKSFAISDFSHKLIDPEDVLMTYVVTVKGTQGKQDISGAYRTASVWHRSGKLWRAVFHSQVKVK